MRLDHLLSMERRAEVYGWKLDEPRNLRKSCRLRNRQVRWKDLEGKGFLITLELLRGNPRQPGPLAQLVRACL